MRLMPSISTWKLYPRSGSIRSAFAIVAPPFDLGFLDQSAGCGLGDAEDDEFGGLHRGDADLDDQPAVVDVVLCHRRRAADRVERLLLLQPEQGAVAP